MTDLAVRNNRRTPIGEASQIILNLLSNAIKFTEKDGVISVTCEADDDSVNLLVKDTGLGIPVDKIGAVCDARHQREDC